MAKGEMALCAVENCGERFVKKTANQKYCSQECCRAETNRKTLAAYHRKKNRLRTTVRECLNCDSRLSKYNEGDICQKCLLERNDISALMSKISKVLV